METLLVLLKSDSRSCRENNYYVYSGYSRNENPRDTKKLSSFVYIVLSRQTRLTSHVVNHVRRGGPDRIFTPYQALLWYWGEPDCGPGGSRTPCLFIANEAFNQVNFGPNLFRIRLPSIKGAKMSSSR